MADGPASPGADDALLPDWLSYLKRSVPTNADAWSGQPAATSAAPLTTPFTPPMPPDMRVASGGLLGSALAAASTSGGWLSKLARPPGTLDPPQRSPTDYATPMWNAIPSPGAVWPVGMLPFGAGPAAPFLSSSLPQGPAANAAPVQPGPSAPLPWMAYSRSGPQDLTAWSHSPAVQWNAPPPTGSGPWSSFRGGGQRSSPGPSGDMTGRIASPEILSRVPTPPDQLAGVDAPPSAPAPAVDPFQIATQRAWEGAKFGFGDRPLGLSGDDITKYPNTYLTLQPFVAPLDFALRSMPAAIYGGAGLLGGLYEALGGDPVNAADLARDAAVFAEVAFPEARMLSGRAAARLGPARDLPTPEPTFRPPLSAAPRGDPVPTPPANATVTPNPAIKLPGNPARALPQNSQLTFDLPAGDARTDAVPAESGGPGQAAGPGGTIQSNAPRARARRRASTDRNAQGSFDLGPDNEPAERPPPAADERYTQPDVPATTQTVAEALRAAVESGKINEGEAAFLRQRSAGWQENRRARLQAALAGNLPPYDHETTYGLLVTNEGDVVPLQSGDADPVYANYPAASHVEGKAAIWMRKLNSTGGVVYHNNTGGVCGRCNSNIPTLLPEGAILEAVSPPNAVATKRTYQVAPKPWVGNAETPLPNTALGGRQ